MSKTQSRSLLLTVILLVAAGFSFAGFDVARSLQNTTVTTTYMLTIQTTYSNSVLSDSYIINGTAGTQYGCSINYYQTDRDAITLSAGNIRVSYSSAGGAVNLWVMSQDEYSSWTAPGHDCNSIKALPALVTRLYSHGDDIIVSIPTAGVYYFVFDNENRALVSVRINIETVQTWTMSQTGDQTNVTRPSFSLGPAFYFGVILVLGAVALSLTKGTLREKSKKFNHHRGDVSINIVCPNCGLQNPARARFCKGCRHNLTGTRIYE